MKSTTKTNAVNHEESVFNGMCHLFAVSEGPIVVSSRDIAALTGYSLYRIRKTLKLLEGKGLIVKGTETRPSVYSYEGECICEASAPRNGWKLTDKGNASKEYKEAAGNI